MRDASASPWSATMANQFLAATEYANVMLLLLKNQLVYGRLVDGQFKDQVTDENGLTINIKRPPRFVQNDASALSAALAAQDILTGSTNVAVNQYGKVHISVGDIEYVQSYNALMQNETMKSAASTLAHQVDSFVASQTLKFHSWAMYSATTGVTNALTASVGNAISTPAMAMAAHTRLMNQGVPNTDICGVVDFSDGQLIRGALLSAFTPSINVSMLQRVKIPLISEIDWYATQQNPALTTGDASKTAGQIKGANQNVNYRDVKTTNKQNLITDTYGNAKTIKKGEVFTIANVFAWDWRKNVALPYLQQFTVLADVTTDGADGSATLSISPPIIVQGSSDGTDTNGNTAFATVDSVPADNAILTFVGAASTTYKVKAAWQKRAIALVSARLHMPFTGTASFAMDPQSGIALRYWRGSDISTGAHVHRWDMIYGAEVVDPFLGTRISGS
jgi:hypothetical protein